MSDTKISARVGERFEVTLDANPTTGFRWQPEMDSARLELVEHSLTPRQGGVGGGGVEKFVFIPRRSGNLSVRFLLKRPWEKTAKEVRAFDVTASE